MLELERIPFKRRDISVVPLIDVIFQLLIFFMMAGSVQKFEVVPINPPIAESTKVVEESELVILMGTHDELIVNDQMVTLDDLLPIITDALDKHPNKVITIKADASLQAAKLIELMDYVKAAGGKNISLLTQVPLKS